MTAILPGPLYERTASLTKPLFQFYMDDQASRYDDDITSVTIRRGLGEPGGGVAISTMEVVLPTVIPYPTLTGRTAGLNIIGTRAEEIAALTGYPEPLNLQARFKGRIGPLRVTDNGDGRNSSTTLSASSWIAQESTSKHRANLTAGMSLDAAMRALLYRAPNYYAFLAYGPWDSLLEAVTDASFEDTMSKLAGDYEVLIADRRNGDAHALSLPYLWSQAQARVNTTAPLTRSQAISPATWEQTSETSPQKYRFLMTEADGTPWSTTRFLEEQVAADAETETVDWRRFGQLTDHWDYATRAIVHRNNVRAYRIPSVTVDLLRLLDSDNEYHRRQAGELLALETGQTINFSGDWHPSLQGIQTVTGMTETITGRSWTMELALSPLIDVFGHYPPAIPALVWDSATYPWNSETRIWNH